jgi:hypothetical protein
MTRLACGISVAMIFVSVSPGGANAHHSFAGFYDRERIVEIEGVLTEVSWRNPHGRLRVDVTDAAGRVTEWSIETGTISIFRVRGIDPDFAQVGDRVRLAGQASLRSPSAMYAQQMLLADGHEVLLSIGIEPRWTNSETGELLEPAFDADVAAEARRNADGIFRVWSTVLEDPAAFPMFKGGYPLTQRGKELKAQWDAESIVLNGCTKKAMPLLMITPFPIEFVRDGADILIRFEEDDAVRRIHMGPRTGPSRRFSDSRRGDGRMVLSSSRRATCPRSSSIPTACGRARASASSSVSYRPRTAVAWTTASPSRIRRCSPRASI